MGSLTHAIILYDRACRAFNSNGKPIQDQLALAIHHLDSVRDELPSDLQSRHQSLMDDMKRVDAKGGEGIIAATANSLTDEECNERRITIIQIYDDLVEAKEQSTPKRR